MSDYSHQILEAVGWITLMAIVLAVAFVSLYFFIELMKTRRLKKNSELVVAARVALGVQIEEASGCFGREPVAYETLNMLGLRLREGKAITGRAWRDELYLQVGTDSPSRYGDAKNAQ